MVRVGWVVKTVTVLGLFVAAVETAPMLEGTTGDSPRAIPVKDPDLGYNAIFRPVPSCLSEVILVIYIQCLEVLDRLHFYKDMYGPFVREVEFYVDGTWCDPRARKGQSGFPCYGPPLDRSILPEGVHVVDHNGGGWLMQRSLIDAIGRPRERVDHAGFLFIGDDVLLNLGQLTRAVRTSGCDVIWRSDHNICEDVKKEGGHDRVFGRFLSQAREFSRLSDEIFNDQLARNLGTSSTYCMGSQNDFIYIPTKMATAWTKVAQQMTDVGLVFTYTFNTAIYGIASMEDMVVLWTNYLSKENRSDNLLQGSTFHRESQPYCWSGTGEVADLLSMHIIHPNKIAFSEKSRDFALTVNPSGPGVNISLSLPEHSDEAIDSIVQATDTFAFWCDN